MSEMTLKPKNWPKYYQDFQNNQDTPKPKKWLK